MNEVWQSEIVSTFLMFILALAAGSVLPLGSEWFFLALLSQGSSVVLITFSATLGNTLGGWLTFILGRYAGTKLREHQAQDTQRRWRYARATYQKLGVWSLLLSWVPLLGDVLVVIAGVMKTPTGLSLSLIFIGKALRYVMIAYTWQAGSKLLG